MTKQIPQESAPDGPRLSARGTAARAERQARQAEALRDNLRKRKAQERGRAAGSAFHDGGSEDGGAA